MRLETFFEKFNRFADTPDGVAKLRELMLRMSTSGRIAKQHSSDQPATELLKQIFVKRDKLIRDGIVRNRVDGKPITAGDTVRLPPSWGRCMISEVCDLQTGATPSREEHSYFGGNIRWLVSGDINKGEITECEGRITQEGLKNSNCKIIPKDSVLIALNGQGKTRATVAILRVPATLNQSLVAMIPYSLDHLLPEYIFWNLRGRYYSIRDITGQDQRRGLNMKLVGQLSIPIPPLAEQKRIVATVDELMTLCDQLEALQQDRESRHVVLARASLARFADTPNPANLQFLFHKSYDIAPADLRKSILTLAVQGKLVVQDPTDAPTIRSVELVAKEAKKAVLDGKIRRHGLDADYNDDELPVQPLGWRWTRLPEITRPVPYAIKRGPFGSAIRKDMFVPAGFKIYEQQHAISGDFTKGRYYINKEKFEELIAFELHPDEILVSCSGTVGKVAIVPRNIERGIINQALLKLSLHQAALLNEYFLILFPAFFMETETLTDLSGTAQKNIPGMDVLKAMPFPLPPLAEQRRIVAKVNELMALVDELESQLVTARATAEKLMEAVVAEISAVA